MQTSGQNMFQHGESVLSYFNKIYFAIKHGLKLEEICFPDWIWENREKILVSLLPYEQIAEYLLFHDCGKPYCRVVDDAGKQHFPNHSEQSAITWKDLGGDPIVCDLMRYDMRVHCAKNIQDLADIPLKYIPTLLLAALSEVHSNATMFGGTDSVSFKIKWKTINKLGKQYYGEIHE